MIRAEPMILSDDSRLASFGLDMHFTCVSNGPSLILKVARSKPDAAASRDQYVRRSQTVVPQVDSLSKVFPASAHLGISEHVLRAFPRVLPNTKASFGQCPVFSNVHTS